MATIYNIKDIDGNSISENVSIEDINAIFEGDEINLFWDDEGLAARLKEGDEDTSNIQLISTIVEEEEE